MSYFLYGTTNLFVWCMLLKHKSQAFLCVNGPKYLIFLKSWICVVHTHVVFSCRILSFMPWGMRRRNIQATIGWCDGRFVWQGNGLQTSWVPWQWIGAGRLCSKLPLLIVFIVLLFRKRIKNSEKFYWVNWFFYLVLYNLLYFLLGITLISFWVPLVIPKWIFEWIPS